MNIIFYAVWVCNVYICWLLLRRHLKLHSPFIFFWIGLFSVFIIPSVIDPGVEIFKGHELSVWFERKTETLILAQIICFACLSLFVFFDTLLPVKKINFAPLHKDKSGAILLPLVLLGLTIIPIMELTEKFGSLFFLNLTFLDRRESLSYVGQMLLGYNVITAAGLAYWAYTQNKKIFAMVCVMFYIVMFSFLGGSRQPLVAVFLPFIGFYLFGTKYRNTKTVVFLVATQLVVIALALMLVVRNQPSIADKIDLLINPGQLMIAVTDRPSDTNVRFAFYYFIENFSKFDGFGNLSYLFRTLLFWLPSPLDVLNIKPSDFEYIMFQYYMPYEVGTMHPTFFGSIIADSGFLFPVWIALIHLFQVVAMKLASGLNSRLYQLLVWTALGLGALMMARGSLYSPVVTGAFAIILFMVASKFTFNFQKNLIERACIK